MALKPKQQLFLNEYLIDMNATQAAIRAGYSAKSAYSVGQRMLKNAEVSAEIHAKIDEKGMKADEILERLAKIARGDMGDFMDISSMNFRLDLNKAKELGLTHLIKKVKQKTTIILSKKQEDDDRQEEWVEVELYSALEALQLLGRHHKLFVDRTELTGKDGESLVSSEQIDKALKKIYGNNSD